MKLNRRGDIGFPEAMISVMMVTIVLTAYLGAFVLHTADIEEKAPEFDRRITQTASVAEGKIVMNINDALSDFLNRSGCKGVIVKCSAFHNRTTIVSDASEGIQEGKIISERYSQVLKGDEGRIYTATFEVGLWY